MNKTRTSSAKKLFSSFSAISLKLLHVGLPIILCYLLAFLFIALSSQDLPPSVLAHIYAPSLEYVIMALTITVIGALVADIAERHANK